MLGNVKLTKLNTIKHLNINLANASFCAPKNKASVIMSSDKSCISVNLKHMLSCAITEKLLLSKMSPCNTDTKKPNYKYKGNCGLLSKNYSANGIQLVKGVSAI